MIVIATHEGRSVLEKLLDSLVLAELGRESVLVVDTQSSPEYYTHLQTLVGKYPYPLTVTQTPYKGYDTGAYIYAYQHYPDQCYFFLHDSLEIKDPAFFVDVKAVLTPDKLISFILFRYGFDSDVQRNWAQTHFGSTYYDLGIFGPMFACQRSVLDKLNGKWVIPSTKEEQQGMERGWAILCHANNIEIQPLEKQLHNAQLFHSDSYRYLRKRFLYRS